MSLIEILARVHPSPSPRFSFTHPFKKRKTLKDVMKNTHQHPLSSYHFFGDLCVKLFQIKFFFPLRRERKDFYKNVIIGRIISFFGFDPRKKWGTCGWGIDSLPLLLLSLFAWVAHVDAFNQALGWNVFKSLSLVANLRPISDSWHVHRFIWTVWFI